MINPSEENGHAWRPAVDPLPTDAALRTAVTAGICILAL
jgi:hypothetical protein